MRKMIIAGILAMFAAACWAQEGAAGKGQDQNSPGSSSMRHARMFGMAFNEELFPPEAVMQSQQALGLTDDQKKSILDVMKDFSVKFTELQWKQGSEQETMSELLKQDKIDETKALAQLDKLMAIENEIKKVSLYNMIKIRNLLTAEQRSKMKSIRQSMMSKMMEGRGGQNRPQPPKPPEE